MLALSLLTVALSTSAAAAPFEGVMRFSLQLDGKDGTMTTYVSKKAGRADMEVPAGEGRPPMKVRMLFDAAQPDKLTLVHEANRSFMSVDVANAQKAAGPGEAQKPPKLEKLGKDKVLGHPCQRARLTYEDGAQVELCSSKEFNRSPFFASLMQQAARSPSRYEGALEKAGLQGLPLRMVASREGRPQLRMELTEVSRKSLPAETFAIPEGYSELQTPQLDPRQLEQLKGQLQKLPPAQRKALEEMMRKQGATP